VRDNSIAEEEPEEVAPMPMPSAIRRSPAETFIRLDDLNDTHRAVVTVLGLGDREKVSLEQVTDAYQRTADPLARLALEAVREAWSTPAAPAQAAQSAKAVGALDETDQRILAELDKHLVGQLPMKMAAVEFIRENRDEFASESSASCLGLAGPPGTGKSFIAKVVAKTLGANDILLIDGAEFQDKTALNKVKGGAAGLVGYGDGILQPDKIKAAAGTGPLVVLVDEVDKMDPDVRDALFNTINSALNDNRLQTSDGKMMELPKTLWLFASNAGDKTKGSRTGAALEQHYVDSFNALLEDHQKSRVGKVVATHAHDQDGRRRIIDQQFDEVAREMETKILDKRDIDVSIELAEDALNLLATLTESKRSGARPIARALKSLVAPKLRKIGADSLDGERYEVRIKPGTGAQELARLKRRFNAADGEVPDGITKENFPLEAICVNPQTRLEGYAGEIPHSPVGKVNVYGSGRMGDQSFVVMDKGDGSRVELLFYKAGSGRETPAANQALDSFRVVELPEALAGANMELQVTPIGEDRLFFHSVSASGDSDEPQSISYIYDTAKKPPTWKAVADAPPMMGAALASSGDKVFLIGGRELYHDGVAWSASPTIAENNGVPLEAQIHVFDTSTGEWTSLSMKDRADYDIVPRAGYSVAVSNGLIYLVGGEELTRNVKGKYISSSSKKMDVLDPESLRFHEGPPLDAPVSYATATTDGYGRVILLGGLDHIHDGTWVSPTNIIQSLNTEAENSQWKVRDVQLPNEGSQFAVLDGFQGSLVFPFGPEGSPEGRVLR
jgi:hypothetical protein